MNYKLVSMIVPLLAFSINMLRLTGHNQGIFQPATLHTPQWESRR